MYVTIKLFIMVINMRIITLCKFRKQAKEEHSTFCAIVRFFIRYRIYAKYFHNIHTGNDQALIPNLSVSRSYHL